MITKAYEELGNAIVIQAAKDYREAFHKLKNGRKNTEAQYTKAECLRFFRSHWFSALTSIDPEFLIRNLDREA